MMLIRPVQQLYTTTAEFEDANADLDNVRHYIEDNLKYADKVNVYTGYNSITELLSNANAAQMADIQLKAGTTDEYESVTVNKQPADFFRKYYYDNVESKYTDTFIMEISNAPASVDASGNPTGCMGSINIYNYNLKTDSYTLVSQANEEYYKKYSYNFHLGVPETDTNGNPTGSYVGFDKENAVISIDIFKNDFTDSDSDGNYFTELMRNDNTKPDTAASFAFVNMNMAGSEEIKVELAEGTVAEDSDFEKKEDSDGKSIIYRKAMRYKLFDSGAAGDNIYFIYTTPEILG
jgi:hypothetical protein